MDVNSKVLGRGGRGSAKDVGGDQGVEGAVSRDSSFVRRTLHSCVVTEAFVGPLKHPQQRLGGYPRTLQRQFRASQALAARLLEQAWAETEGSNPTKWRHLNPNRRHSYHSHRNNCLVRSVIFLPCRSETDRLVGNSSFGDRSTVRLVNEREERVRKEKEAKGDEEELEVHHDPYLFRQRVVLTPSRRKSSGGNQNARRKRPKSL